jgi:ribosomal protein L2
MAKRSLRSKEAYEHTDLHTEESEYRPGVVVLFYDDGWRAGHITEIDVADDGELSLTIQPVGGKGSPPKRKVIHKSKDVKLG